MMGAKRYFTEVDQLQWNIANLCLFLNISKRKYMSFYEKPEYADAIGFISTKIEDKYLQELMGKYPTGAIFALKNFAGYTDQKDVKTTFSGNITLEQLVKETKVKA